MIINIGSQKIDANDIGGTVAITNGGTGASDAATARANLGVAPTSHASTATTYGIGNASNYGHVKLSDSTTSDSKASDGVAASPAAVKAAYNLANEAKTLAESSGSVSEVVAIEKGGTGATTAASARTNLGITPSNIGAAASSHSHNANTVGTSTSTTSPQTFNGYIAAKSNSSYTTPCLRNFAICSSSQYSGGSVYVSQGDLIGVY